MGVDGIPVRANNAPTISRASFLFFSLKSKSISISYILAGTMSKIPDSASQDPYGQPEEPDRLILKAKEIFSEARADTENVQKFFDLSDEGAPIEEQEKCLVPLFQKLVFLVTGRKDVDLAPPVVEYIIPFRTLLDQRLLKRASDRSNNKKESPEDIAIRRLTNYIIKEDEKLRKIESNKSSAVTRSVEQAWETGYVGETDRLLRDAISSMYSKSSSLPYANFCPIIQGSGTGKSRLVDKLAESVFTIPITLRPLADDKGFPLGDTANGKALLDFFCKPEYFTSALHAQLYYLQFLLKSLAIAGNWIDDYKRSGRGTENIAAEWRQHLGTPRTAPRNHLYGQATDPSALETFEDILDESVRFIDLQARVKNFVGAITDKIKSKTDKGPVILFYFDEAQHLTAFTVTKGEKEPRRTAYQCLCKAFTYMLDVPVFTLFLSTYSRLSEFSPSARNFWSARLLASTSKESNDNLNAPFVELPFDAWKSPTIVKEGSHSGDEICSLRFMARFGRPMFWALFESPDATDSQVIGLAMSKLKLHFEDTRKPYNIHTYDELIPLLAARVDFTFESNRDEAVFLEGLLVASAMRTVYSVPKHRQYLRGGYPSEPLLAEAAARAILAYFRSIAEGKASITTIITQYKYDIPLAVSAWFQRGLIDKGSRGELVARMLCTLAHDISILKKLTDGNLDENASFSQMITVADFFRALIAEEYVDKVLDAQPGNSTKGEPLKKVFENAYVHFTQFVKAGDKSAMTDTAAYLLFTRGAAIQGHGTMPDVDFIIPVWIRGDSNPDRWSMTAIFIQVKNRKAKQTIHIDMQKKHKFFTKGKERPYITIAMQLGLSVENKSKDKLVKVSPPHVKKLRDNKEKYPRYEISIDGCSNKTYNVIGDASATYSALLAERDILSEHPREGKFLDAVKRMKPFWKLESYNWASIRKSLDPHAKDQPEDWLVGLDRGQKGEENRLITDLSGLHIES